MTASNITYVRWQREQSRRCREFGPLDREHPAYKAPCILCRYSLGSDTVGVQLVAVGPDDPRAEADHERGRWYSAIAVCVHTSCLAQLTDDDLEVVVRELVQVPADHPAVAGGGAS